MDVLGDLGGIYGSFEIIGLILFTSYSERLLTNSILKENFEFIDKKKSSKKVKLRQKHVNTSLQSTDQELFSS